MLDDKDSFFKRDIEDDQCHFVNGNPGRHDWYYCGCPVSKHYWSGSYCEYHYRICYISEKSPMAMKREEFNRVVTKELVNGRN